MLVDLHIVLHWHQCKGYNPPTKAINSTNMCDSTFHFDLYEVCAQNNSHCMELGSGAVLYLSVCNCMHSHKRWTYSTRTTNRTDSLLHSVECWNVLHSSEGTAQMLCVPWKTAIHGCIRGAWSNKWKQAVQIHYRSCSDVQLSLNIQYDILLIICM